MVEALAKKLLRKTDDNDLVKKAISLADFYHRNQLRITGEPFICHPLKVATNVASYTNCINTISAAVLHDVIEDSEATFSSIHNDFGSNVAHIVDGLTRCIKPKAFAIKYIIKQLFNTDDNLVNDCFKIIFDLDDHLVLMHSTTHKLLKQSLKKLENTYKEHNYKDTASIPKITTELMHMLENMQNFLPDNQIPVIDNLKIVFNSCDDETIRKICLVKICDRIDNLKTLHIFDKAKQQKMKQNAIHDILPLSIYIENDDLSEKIMSICGQNNSDKKIHIYQHEFDMINYSKFNVLELKPVLIL